VVVALAAATALTACVGGSEPDSAPPTTSVAKEVVPRARDCFRDDGSTFKDPSPDFATRVKCTKRHLFEVTGSNRGPDRFLDAAGRPGDTVRDRLVTQSGPDQRSLEQYAKSSCSKHLWRAMGVDADDIRSDGTRLSEIGAFPVLTDMAYLHTLTPEPAWTKGRHSLICFVEFTRPNDGQATAPYVSSYNLKPVFEKFLGRHFPTERRRCAVRSGEGRTSPEPCTRAHDAEIVFTFDARLAFGLPFVKDAIRTGINDEVIDRMVQLCEDVLPQLLESQISPELTAWIWYGNDSSAWNQPVELADETDDYPVECQLRPSDPSLVLAPGTIMGRAGYPELEYRSYRSDA
jgi:hypothetical protein